MRWSAIVASLRHSHSASLSRATLNPRNRALLSSLPRNLNPQRATALPSQEQPRSSAQSSGIADLRRTPPAHVGEVGSAFPGQGNFAPIRPSSKTKAISEAKDSSFKSEAGHRGSSSAARPYQNISTRAERAWLSTSEVVKRQPLRSESEVKVSGKFGRSTDNFASARTIEPSPSQTEVKGLSRALGNGLPSKSATNTRTTQVVERHVGAAYDALRLKNGSSSADDAGLSEDVSASSTRSSLENAEGTAVFEGKIKAGSKKSFAVSFPVTVFIDWWFSCFSQGNRLYYTSLNHPLNKVYVWLIGYQRAHFDATGHYADGPNSAVLMQQLLDLQNAVLEGRFRWGDKKHAYLSEPTGRNEESLSNVISFPSFQDRVVHEILHLVLEPIFEARFSPRSHGSRPGRDAHTALGAVQRSFQGCTWFIHGNMSFLHEEKYVSHLVDSVSRFVKDTRVIFLLKSGFLEDMSETEGSTCQCVFTDHSKLRNLLCNAFLDQFDWFMDEQISSLSKKEKPSSRSSSGLLFKPKRAIVERPRKLEYLRYGAEILVACSGTREENEPVKESIIDFFKQKFNVELGNMLTISHISDGVHFLDHVILRKIAHPIVSCRRASSGRIFEKRAHRIRLYINASREHCIMYLEKMKAPTSLQRIEKMLSILDNWYHYAENKEKVMQFCKSTLCHLYVKCVMEKQRRELMNFDEQFKEAMHMVAYGQAKSAGSAKSNLLPDFFWIPKHENALRSHAVLQNKPLMAEAAASFKTLRTVSPQQHMSQVLWQYVGGFCGGHGDNSGESETHMQISSPGQELVVDPKLEDFAESVG